MKSQCAECRWEGNEDEWLEAPHPFEHGELIHGCPNCHTIGSFIMICDEEGCHNPVSSGWPTEDGYRQTCHQHTNWKQT